MYHRANIQMMKLVEKDKRTLLEIEIERMEMDADNLVDRSQQIAIFHCAYQPYHSYHPFFP